MARLLGFFLCLLLYQNKKKDSVSRKTFASSPTPKKKEMQNNHGFIHESIRGFIRGGHFIDHHLIGYMVQLQDLSGNRVGGPRYIIDQAQDPDMKFLTLTGSHPEPESEKRREGDGDNQIELVQNNDNELSREWTDRDSSMHDRKQYLLRVLPFDVPPEVRGPDGGGRPRTPQRCKRFRTPQRCKRRKRSRRCKRSRNPRR